MTSPDICPEKEMRFEHITVEDGLPDMLITDIVQDYQGFLWFATQKGLVKYDGYRLTVYKPEAGDIHSLGGLSLQSICEDVNNNIWIGTENGLSRYNKETDRFDTFSPDINKTNILEGGVQSICEGESGYLYVTLITGGYLRFDMLSKTFKLYSHNPSDDNSISSNYAACMCKEDDHIIWVGTSDAGLNKFDIESQTFKNYKNKPGDSNSISSNLIICIYNDHFKNLWVGTNNGLNKFDRKTETFSSYGISPEASVNLSGTLISCIYEDKAGDLWLGTYGLGLIKFTKEKSKFTQFRNESENPYSLSNNWVHSICEDRSGILWIGNKAGINIYDKEKSKFVHFKNIEKNEKSLTSGGVRSIIEDKSGTLWIGTENGLNRFNNDDNTFSRIVKLNPVTNTLSDDYIACLLEDSDGILWIGTRFGFTRYDTEKGFFKNYELDMQYHANILYFNAVKAIWEDKTGFLWLGTNAGLFKYDKKNDILSRYFYVEGDSGISGSIESIYEDRSGILWIGTNPFGLKRFDRGTEKFTSFKYSELEFSCVSSICEDKSGKFWLGDYFKGLLLFDRITGSVTSFTEKEGLYNDTVRSILEDDGGKLWIGSEKGLSNFDPQLKTFRYYIKSDGLPISEFRGAAAKDNKGYLYFGGPGGFIKFYPDSLQDNSFPPPVVLTDFKLFNKSVKPAENSPLKKNINVAEEIVLLYKENIFSFEFAALDYRNPLKNMYAYKLEGFNKDWVYTDAKNRTASYTNIDPGEYIFRVKGTNNDGLWNETGASIKIIITPPWWQTWWFRASGILSIAGAIGLAFYRRLSAVKHKEKEQEDFTRQLRAAHEEERKRIAGELHDSLGQNLLIIKNKAVLNLKKNEFNSEIINEISELSSSALQEVREISYNLHPYQLERLGLTKAIESITERALKSTNITFKDELDIIDKIFNPEAEINIYRVIQECINNIIKHSGASEAKLIIKKEQDKVTITIRDNGKGFDTNAVLADKSKRGIGLMDINERAKLFNGKIEFESAPGRGTTCRISIPLNQ